MNNPTASLKDCYDSFANQTNAWGFILGLADYIELVLENKDNTEIVSKLSEEKNQDKDPKKTEPEIYEIWEQLNFIPLVIYNDQKSLRLNKDNPLFKITENDLKILKNVGNGLPSNTHLNFSTIPYHQIILEKYKRYSLKLHNFLIKKLNQPASNLDTLAFSNRKSVLRFSNKDIPISKTGNTRPHYLLRTIFKDKNKLWSYDEIADDLSDDAYGKNSWTKYYQAGYAINEKIAKETGIKDFLKVTSKDVSINKNYL